MLKGTAMNWRRGFFRVWVIFVVLWIIGVGAIFGPDILREWDQLRLKQEFDAGKYVTLLPVDCQQAAGREGKLSEKADYEKRDGNCWYELPTFRRLFPAYTDMSDEALSKSLYAKAGIPIKEWNPSPLTLFGKWMALALGVPLAILAFGCVCTWAVRGFKAV